MSKLNKILKELDMLEEAAEIIRCNPDFFEITLHGICHEHWDNGSFTRGEWYDTKGKLRAERDINKRLDLFAQLLNDHNLGSFPESYVPPSFTHIFSPVCDSLLPILKGRGIKNMSTPFSTMLNRDAAQTQYFGVDLGMITVDRGYDVFNWKVYNRKPQGEITGPICGMHWPNMLHEDPEKNMQVVDKWGDFLKPYDLSINTLLAGDTKQMVSQLVYHESTEIKQLSNGIELNFERIKDLSISHFLFSNFKCN